MLAAGCGAERADVPPDEEPWRDLLDGAPLYQPAAIRDIRKTAEAYEMVLLSPSGPDSVAAWYRRQADASGWETMGDVRTPDGAISMSFERDGPGLWLMIRPGPDGEGSEFSLIGAARDTTQRQP
jgi:hypothetical protein